MTNRVVFYDEDEGKVKCRSEICNWIGECDYLYNHYKNNHESELLASDDNKLTLKYKQNSDNSNKIYLACISDSMFWIYERIHEDQLQIALQYAEYGEFIYNIRIRSSSDDMIVGTFDMHAIYPKSSDFKKIFSKDHFSIKLDILDKMVAENNTPSFELTLKEGLKIENETNFGVHVQKEEDGEFNYKSFNNARYDVLTFNMDIFKCLVCECKEVHVSELMMCDADHAICPGCKKDLDCCPIEACGSPYSSSRNPAIERAIKLLGLEGLHIHMA